MTTADFYAQDTPAQVARLEALARRALAHFGLPATDLTLVNYTNNAMFRVGAGERTYALRVQRPAHRPRPYIESEIAWLRAIRCGTPLIVPAPAGDLYAGTLDGVEVPVYGVLFDWIDGQQPPPTALTAAHYTAIGAFMAALHDFSRAYTPPAGFDRPRRDWAGLVGGQSDYAETADEDQFITPEQHAILRDAGEHIRRVMDALDAQPGAFGLIHADLIVKNVVFTGEAVAVIDFDDCGWGYYLYDLAPMLWMSRGEPGYADLRKALWGGYTAGRGLPPEHEASLDALVAARHIASCRWVLGNRHHPALRGQAQAIITQRMHELARFLETGRLGA